MKIMRNMVAILFSVLLLLSFTLLTTSGNALADTGAIPSCNQASPNTLCWDNRENRGCNGPETREVRLRLWNIPKDTTWEVACANSSAKINGEILKPFCHNTGGAAPQMWGFFSATDSNC